MTRISLKPDANWSQMYTLSLPPIPAEQEGVGGYLFLLQTSTLMSSLIARLLPLTW